MAYNFVCGAWNHVSCRALHSIDRLIHAECCGSTGIFPFSETDYDSLVLDSILTKNIDEDTPEPSKVVTKMKKKSYQTCPT